MAHDLTVIQLFEQANNELYAELSSQTVSALVKFFGAVSILT